jgi:hypothetical protein
MVLLKRPKTGLSYCGFIKCNYSTLTPFPLSQGFGRGGRAEARSSDLSRSPLPQRGRGVRGKGSLSSYYKINALEQRGKYSLIEVIYNPQRTLQYKVYIFTFGLPLFQKLRKYSYFNVWKAFRPVLGINTSELDSLPDSIDS